MRNRAFMVLAASACLVLAAYAGPSTPAKAGKETVGSFAVRVANAMGETVTSPQAAATKLRARGVNLSNDLSATLTEGEAARIVGDLGVKVVAPADPSATVSSTKAGTLAGVIAASTEALVTPADLSLPNQCLSSVDRGHCVDCCIAAVGPLPDSGGGTRTAGKECSKFCAANVPPVSSGEPTP